MYFYVIVRDEPNYFQKHIDAKKRDATKIELTDSTVTEKLRCGE